MANAIELLSDREREILKLVATGATNQQIANDLSISINTVKVHVRNIFGKLGTESRTEASIYAVRAGLVAGAPPTPDGNGVATVGSTSVVTSPPVVYETVAAPQVAKQYDEPVAPPRARQYDVSPRTRSGYTRWLPYGIIALFVFGIVAYLSLRNEAPAQPPQTIAPVTSALVPQWIKHTTTVVSRIGAAAATVDGNMYVIGGQTANDVTGAFERYEPPQERRTPLTAKTLAVADIQAGVLGGKIYVPGGRQADGTISNKLEVYDPTLGQWRFAKELPEPRSAYALATLDGRLYVIGGWDGKTPRNDMFIYDPATDSWKTGPALITPRLHAGATVVDNLIYVMGGEDTGGTALAAHEVFTPGTQSWASKAPLKTARTRAGIGSFANYVYLFGGAGSDAPLFYDVRNDVWQTFPAPDVAIGPQPAVAERDRKLFVLSGGEGAPILELVSGFQLTLPSLNQ